MDRSCLALMSADDPPPPERGQHGQDAAALGGALVRRLAQRGRPVVQHGGAHVRDRQQPELSDPPDAQRPEGRRLPSRGQVRGGNHQLHSRVSIEIRLVECLGWHCRVRTLHCAYCLLVLRTTHA
jgi:hypothetical protein